ncbi:glycosyltransferase family 9 protein [Dyadobacter diqingensis]|uniref:glycosyltransferase family 9 protein n=1 Tax=Dyadobacter diqingensis TaxID=2938121 RepID=UPI0020C1B2A7|nr:glycosyltransferase family 9 protein [Dyadobacter diqingensis]
MHILVTRTDAIGDVVLALPLCGYLKKTLPDTRVSILARSYTRSVAEASNAVDHFINYDDILALPENEQVSLIKQYQFDVILHLKTERHITTLAKKARIPIRVGTISRPYHWANCNRFVWLRRKVSDDHEGILHFRLARPLGIRNAPDNIWEYYQLTKYTALPEDFSSLLNTEKFTIILHPKSHGNALEWDLKRFSELIGLLDKDLYRIFITGSEKEHGELKPWLKSLPEHVIDMTGQLSLSQLITFIKKTDGLVAGSTGPVHLAAACGINTLGLYPHIRPKHAGRWGPIGPKADYIETTTETLDSISATAVFEKIRSWQKM